MENLKKEFEERYKDYMMPVIIDKSEASDINPTKTAPKSKKVVPEESNDNDVKKRAKSSTKKSLPDHLNAIFASDNYEDGEDISVSDQNSIASNGDDVQKTSKCATTTTTATTIRNSSGKRIEWEPLRFPPLPETGDFDINEVSQSR